MKTALLSALILIAGVSTSLAQSITAFAPADGAENVPLNTSVTITFDTPIPAGVEAEDIGFIMEPVTLIYPEEEFIVDDVTISADRLSVTLVVDLAPDTDYHFAFLGLPGDGVAIALQQIFTTSFSTGQFAGNHSISGTLSYELLSFDFDDDDDFDEARQTAKRLSSGRTPHALSRHTERFQHLLSHASMQKSMPLSTLFENGGLPDEEDLRRRTLVLITNEPVNFFDDMDDDDNWDDDYDWSTMEDETDPVIFALTTVDALTGSYTATRLGNGIYYVTAFYFSEEFMVSEFGESSGFIGFGAYADEDDESLPVTIDGASVSGIDFTVFLFNPDLFDDQESTGLEIYNDLVSQVLTDFPDAQLYVIEGSSFWEDTPFSGSFIPNGESLVWLYRFLEREDMIEINALSILGNLFIVPSSAIFAFDFAPLPHPADTSMIDSDVAMQVALQNGASDLLMENRSDLAEWEIVYRLSRDTEYARDAGIAVETTNPFWLITLEFYPFSDDNTDFEPSITGLYAVDAFTGDFLNEAIITSIHESSHAQLPAQVTLSQNYPNPFNPTTTISFSLPSSSEVRLSVYDITGREVMVLMNGAMPAGQHTVPFNASGTLSSGVYLYRLQAGGEVHTRKMTLIK